MRTIVFLWMLAGLTVASAQKDLTIEEAIGGSRDALAPQRLKLLQFTKNEGELSFLSEEGGLASIMLVDKNGKKKRILTLDEFNASISKVELKPQTSLPFPKWINSSSFEFGLDKFRWSFDIKTKLVTKLTDISATPEYGVMEYASDKKTYAYVKDHNLFVFYQGKDLQLSKDGSREVIYGEAVHRNEFGIEKGLFFSPGGRYLAFYRMDQSMVTDYPIIDWQQRPAKNKHIKYPFAGDKSHQVQIGVFDPEKSTTVYLKIDGDPEQYLTNICWSPDETKIFVAIVNRAQNHMKLNVYDRSSGNLLSTLFEEKDSKYIEPMHPMIFVKNNPSQFIWQSNRDGYRHLYLYDVSGKLIRQLTKGNWEVKELTGFDATGKNFFFHSNISSPIQTDFCKVELSTGKVNVLSSGSGTHTCSLNESATYAVDNFSNATTPRVLYLIDLKTGKSTEIFRAPDPVKEFNKGTLRLFTIKNHEGTDLYCRMFLPVGFDSTKKYPVVVYLYNGPHSQLVTNSWLGGADLWYHYMAQRGYIMFTLDGRGTDNRGRAFSQAIHRQLGKVEMEDQMKGVEWLKGRSYVDGNRMGVHGWSYGGFMTTSLMTRYADVFKAGVAGGPVIDWSYYEIMYGERYMDSPQENKDGYDGNNLLNHIGKLKGKLLVIHGADDDVVVWQHSLLLLRKSVETNVHIDYYVYPGHPHNVRGKDRVHLMDKISRYFFEHLR